MLPPKAPAPLLLVPTPRCICMLFTDEEKSGRLTKNVPWLSASLYGMPLRVTLILLASVPRNRIPVYPTPLPASELITTPGVWFNKKGKS